MSFLNFKKNLSINVSSIDEYFSKVKKEREFFGLYKVPRVLPLDLNFFIKSKKDEKGWTFFYTKIKKQYPVQWFFRHWLFSYDNPVYVFFKKWSYMLFDLKWKFKNYLKPNYPRWRSSLKRHEYKDICNLIEDSNFNLILDFYYEEVVDGWVDWQADEVHKKFYVELLENIRWIEEEKPRKEKEYDKALSYATENHIIDNEGKLDYTATYKHVHAIEDSIKNKTTEILKWLCENRHFFWT
jgi:hypothetical protein